MAERTFASVMGLEHVDLKDNRSIIYAGVYRERE
jgi:hypothetical protein